SANLPAPTRTGRAPTRSPTPKSPGSIPATLRVLPPAPQPRAHPAQSQTESDLPRTENESSPRAHTANPPVRRVALCLPQPPMPRCPDPIPAPPFQTGPPALPPDTVRATYPHRRTATPTWSRCIPYPPYTA